MIRFVPWSEVGTITVSPGDNVVEVGAFELAEGADTLWVRMTNTGTPGPWPWSYGILSFKTDEGQPLGSIKAYNSFDGEVFKLGVGLPPSVRAGVLTFEPRGFNMAWIKQGNPWSLKFEAQSGGSTLNNYWNRDPVNGVLSPVTAGDDVDLGTGNLSATAATFNGHVQVGGNPLNGASAGLHLNTAGVLTLARSQGTDACLRTYTAGVNATTSTIYANGAFAIGGNVGGGNPNITLTPDGSGSFAGHVTAQNIVFRSSDPVYIQQNSNTGAGDYVGPELDLLDEIVRLESLIKHLYDTLRISPPAGWEVWDGNTDLVTSRGTRKGHI